MANALFERRLMCFWLQRSVVKHWPQMMLAMLFVAIISTTTGHFSDMMKLMFGLVFINGRLERVF